MIDHTPDRCGYVSDDPEVTSRHRADGWRCGLGADHKGSHTLYLGDGERVIYSSRWKRGDWIPAAPEHAPTVPRKVLSLHDLQIGQRVAIEHIYSKTRSLTRTGIVLDVLVDSVALEGYVDVKAIADPHYDVEITVLAEAPEPEPEAWVVHFIPSLLATDNEGGFLVGPFDSREDARDYVKRQPSNNRRFQVRPMQAPKEAQ